MTTVHTPQSDASSRARPLRLGVAVARTAVGLGILVAIIATFADSASRGPVNPFNFFGFFTIQSNVLAVVVLIALGANGIGDRRTSPLLNVLRAVATTDMIITGIVYATLLAPLGAAGGAPVPWANSAMHIVGPLFFALDWFVLGGRPVLAWSRIWIALVHPLLWLAVVLIRGATDGWVPYPFLDPAQGYGAVAAYCVGIAVAFVAVGSLVWWSSRWPSLLDGRSAS